MRPVATGAVRQDAGTDWNGWDRIDRVRVRQGGSGVRRDGEFAGCRRSVGVANGVEGSDFEGVSSNRESRVGDRRGARGECLRIEAALEQRFTSGEEKSKVAAGTRISPEGPLMIIVSGAVVSTSKDWPVGNRSTLPCAMIARTKKV